MLVCYYERSYSVSGCGLIKCKLIADLKTWFVVLSMIVGLETKSNAKV